MAGVGSASAERPEGDDERVEIQPTDYPAYRSGATRVDIASVLVVCGRCLKCRASRGRCVEKQAQVSCLHADDVRASPSPHVYGPLTTLVSVPTILVHAPATSTSPTSLSLARRNNPTMSLIISYESVSI
jgi:hypothetical protein